MQLVVDGDDDVSWQYNGFTVQVRDGRHAKPIRTCWSIDALTPINRTVTAQAKLCLEIGKAATQVGTPLGKATVSYLFDFAKIWHLHVGMEGQFESYQLFDRLVVNTLRRDDVGA
jgi:hypothetical protein